MSSADSTVYTLNNGVLSNASYAASAGSWNASAQADTSYAASGSYAPNSTILTAPTPQYAAAAPARTIAIVPASRSLAVTPVANVNPMAIAAPALNEVPLNIDPNPEVINKKPVRPVHYKQQIALKFLKPPTPPQPGDIVIKQEKDVQIAPVPPLLVRQKPPKPLAPAPLVVREQPPAPPAPIPPKVIVIPGKVHPPPPRKVVVERLPKLPQLPQDLVVERWLGYNDRTRRVIFEPAPKLIPLPAPKNTIIQWASPDVQLHREYKFLGVAPASPAQYAATHGASLVHASQLPQLATAHFRAPAGEVLGVQYRPDIPQLVGDVAALRFIDLDAAGLSEYKNFAPQLAPVAASASYALNSASASYAAASNSFASSY